MNEFYQPKINKENQTITFINDADVRKAKTMLSNIDYVSSGKKIKFQNTADFKKATKILNIEGINKKMNENLDWNKMNFQERLKLLKSTKYWKKGEAEKLAMKDVGALPKELVGDLVNSHRKQKNIGENKMRIKISELKSIIREVLTEEEGYDEFFKATAEKFGFSPDELDKQSDEKKKEFFNYIDANWKGKNETLEPVSPAYGNPLKSVKAKKASRILATENYIRKIIREELKFVMFNEVPATASRKRAKKRITQIGDANKTL